MAAEPRYYVEDLGNNIHRVRVGQAMKGSEAWYMIPTNFPANQPELVPDDLLDQITIEGITEQGGLLGFLYFDGSTLE